MTIEARMKDLRITPAVEGPTKIEEPGSKYCCATCYNVYGRVTHVALKEKVSEVVVVGSVMIGPLPAKEYRNFGPVVNVHHKEVAKRTHPGGVNEFHTYCNLCGDTVGWIWTTQNDGCPQAMYWSDALMDRTKLVLLEEKEMNRGIPEIHPGTPGRWECCSLVALRADELETSALREVISQAHE